MNESLYYSVEEFNRYISYQNPFIFFNQNIRSFNQNYDSLSESLTTIKKNIEIIILTETWFTKDSCCSIEGYTGYYCFRTESSGAEFQSLLVSVLILFVIRSSLLILNFTKVVQLNLILKIISKISSSLLFTDHQTLQYHCFLILYLI